MTVERTLAASLKKELARIKGHDEYTWGIYNGPAMEIESRRGTSVTLTRGMRFGSRLSSSGREIRFVFPESDPNLTKVFTIDPDLAKLVYKRSRMN